MKDSTPWVIAAAAVIAVGAGVGALYWYQQRQPAPPTWSQSWRAPTRRWPNQARSRRHRAHPAPDRSRARRERAADRRRAAAARQGRRVVQGALVDLVGRKSMLSFLDTDGFVRRAVATIDNLPRKHAAVRLWPVQPAAGRLGVEQRDDGAYLGAANAARYEPFIRFIESVDTRQAVALYTQLYPLFQQSYEELGYPGRYFNDRLVEVIDHLLATPDTPGPVKLSCPRWSGRFSRYKPWLMYEPADPDLDARSAGQKLLLRMGRTNAQRLKAKLVDVRRQFRAPT